MTAPDASKRDLSLLTQADGTRKRVVTLKEAAEFLGIETCTVHHHMRRGTLASEGSARQRRVLVTSLLAYKPAERGANLRALTPEQRSEISRQGSNARWAKIPDPAERSKINKRNSEKLSHAEWSEIHRAHHAKKPPAVRSAIGKKTWNSLTPEKRDKALRNLDWYKNLTEDERSAVAKGWWDNLSKERQDEIKKARHSPEAKKKSAEKRATRKAEIEAALELLRANRTSAPTLAKRRGAPKKEAAQKVFERWIELGKPRVTVEITAQLAKEFYPTESDRQKVHNRIWATINRLSGGSPLFKSKSIK